MWFPENTVYALCPTLCLRWKFVSHFDTDVSLLRMPYVDVFLIRKFPVEQRDSIRIGRH